MKIGLLSDTHGHLDRTRTAAKLLLEAGSEVVLHAGDIGKEGVLLELAALFDPAEIPVHAVLGNVDLYRDEIKEFPDTTCVRVQPTCELELAGQRVGVIHGHDRRLLTEWMQSGEYDVIITGHTHQRADRTVVATRIINPGAVYRTDQPGCALLELPSGDLRYLDI